MNASIIGAIVEWSIGYTTKNHRRIRVYCVGWVRAVNESFDLLVEVPDSGELLRLTHGSCRVVRNIKRADATLRAMRSRNRG